MVRVKRSSGVPTTPSRHEDSRHEEGEGGNGENGILNPATLSAPPLWIPTDHLFLCESQRSQRAAAHLREVRGAIPPSFLMSITQTLFEVLFLALQNSGHGPGLPVLNSTGPPNQKAT